jgi:hypothetical protein
LRDLHHEETPPSQMVVRCPGCSPETPIVTASAGEWIRCKKCRTSFQVSPPGRPRPDSAPSPAAAVTPTAAAGDPRVWKLGDVILGEFDVER